MSILARATFFGSSACAAHIGLEVSSFARNDVAALPGLGVFRRRNDLFEGDEDFVRVRDKLRVLIQFARVLVTQGRVDNQQRNDQSGADDKSLVERSIHSGPLFTNVPSETIAPSRRPLCAM